MAFSIRRLKTGTVTLVKNQPKKSATTYLRKSGVEKHVESGAIVSWDNTSTLFGDKPRISLCTPHGSPIVKAKIDIAKRAGKLEALILEVQGYHREHAKMFKDAKGVVEVKRKKGELGRTPANMILVKAIVDSAYASGFDRVLLADIKTVPKYRDLKGIMFGNNFSSEKRSRKEVLDGMSHTYDNVRRACGFTKDEWRSETSSKGTVSRVHYWVREFP